MENGDSRQAIGPRRLWAYQVAVELVRHSRALLERVRRGDADVADHMKRALDGVVLAIAEGAGRGSGRDRARFYSMALASGYEAMGCLDLLAAHGAEDPDLARCLATLERLLAMVAGLVRRPA